MSHLLENTSVFILLVKPAVYLQVTGLYPQLVNFLLEHLKKKRTLWALLTRYYLISSVGSLISSGFVYFFSNYPILLSLL